MLGKALANSGARDFSEETKKQLFLQLIRDLTPQHIALLRELSGSQQRRRRLPAVAGFMVLEVQANSPGTRARPLDFTNFDSKRSG
jgi:hypothetical protein